MFSRLTTIYSNILYYVSRDPEKTTLGNQEQHDWRNLGSYSEP